MSSHGVVPLTGPAILVAVGQGGAIGRDGGLPWSAPEDLAYFKAVTQGHHVVIGSLTWESIGRPLPNRHLIVVSRRELDLPEGVTLAADPDAALDLALLSDPAPVVAGGAAVYRALLPRVVRVMRTDITVQVDGADTFFEDLPEDEWCEVAAWPGTDPRLTFRVLDRRS